jgi:hypothetical protein
MILFPRAWTASIAILFFAFAMRTAGGAGEPFTIAPLDVSGAGAAPNALDVESHYYKCRFTLAECGSADSLVYKPLHQELRAENYSSRHITMFCDWIRLADPNPITGHTRNASTLESNFAARMPATYRVVRQSADELVLEFQMRSSTEGGQPWMERIIRRRRLVFRQDTPAIRVESEIVNTDSAAHSVLFDAFNGLGLGRVDTLTCIPGPEGRITAIDPGEEKATRYTFAPEVAGAWMGGVNANGLGAGFSFDWADVDAMQCVMYKTVGAVYHAVMRRRDVPPGKSITFRYTFLPFTGFGTLDGLRDDLAGGVMVGKEADYKADVAARELQAGATVPIRVFLASGRSRELKVHFQCVRREDHQVILDQSQNASMQPTVTVALNAELKLPADGLYILTVTADDGAGAVLRMEKPLEVGRTRLAFVATKPEGEKLGVRDGGEALGPGLPNAQFTTLDLKFVTPHLPMLCNHSQGPVRAMFLTPGDQTLGHVREIVERGDFTVDYCALGKVAIPKGEFSPRSLSNFRRQFRAATPEVLVTLGIDWSAGLKTSLVEELLGRVRGGMGVVLMGLGPEKQVELANAMTDARELHDEAPLPSAAVDVLPVRRWELGKGRIVLLETAMVPTRDEGRGALGHWTNLGKGKSSQPVSESGWRGFEYSYARLAQLIRWAARRASPVTITAATLNGDVVTATIDNAGAPLQAQLGVNARTRRWEVRATGSDAVKIPAGRSLQTIELSQAPDAGPLALELTLANAQRQVIAFASSAVANPSPVELSIIVQPVAQPADKPATFSVQLINTTLNAKAAKKKSKAKAPPAVATAGTPQHGRLHVAVIDRFGRLLHQHDSDLTLAENKTVVPFAVELSPLEVSHEVVATWHAVDPAQHILAEASADLFLLPADPPYADHFVLGLAGSPERDALMIQAGLETARQAGFTLFDHSYSDATLYRAGFFKLASANVSIHTRYGAEKKGKDSGHLDSDRLIMEPPLLPNDTALAATKAAWQAKARKEFESGAFLIGLDDERKMPDDFDLHPQTLAGFHRWLAGRYATIDALNRTWGSQFREFAQVVPKTRKEIGDAPNLAPWLDFRMYIGDVLGEYYMRQPALWAAEISPKLSVCEWGIYEPSATWPVDWSKYARSYKYTTRYGDDQGVLEELFRCFAPETRHGQWMGYGMMSISPERRLAPWRTLFNGGNFALFWEWRESGSNNYALLTSDQRATSGYAALAKEEFPDLTGGIDRLIIASKFLDDRIAVGYSYPSWLAQTDALGKGAKLVIEELGYQHHYVNLEDVTSGSLVRDGYKALVLQQTSCLARQQVDAIRNFVEQGGTLLCLGRCGWRDEHGAPFPEGSLLDALAGIDTRSALPLGQVLAVGDAQHPLSLTVERKGIAIKDAQVLAAGAWDGSTLPVFTVRTQGRGKIYWLNSALEGHRTVHRGGAADERSVALGGPEAIRHTHWELFDQVLRAAGVRPRSQFLKDGKAIFGQETWHYETPSTRTRWMAHDLENSAGPVHVTFDRTGHIYELRTGRYFGNVNAIDDTFPAGCMRIYGVFDYRIAGLKVQAERPVYRRGETARVLCTIETDRGTPDLHAIRIRVAGPNDKELTYFNRVVLAAEGKVNVALPLALNAESGKYVVTAVDAASHAAGRTEFRVEE